MELTTAENFRIIEFTRDMDAVTRDAMFNLFEITKPGRHDIASALITAAHKKNSELCDTAIAYLKPLGLVKGNGKIPKPLSMAIKKAVEENFLVINTNTNLYLKPSPDFSKTDLGCFFCFNALEIRSKLAELLRPQIRIQT